MTLDKKMIRAFALGLLALLLAGLAAECEREEGMWQGGSDSSPSWRRS